MFDITMRQAKLIELLSRTEQYMPAKYFANYLHVSERTIFNDLDKLVEICDELNVAIDKKQNLGIKMIGDTLGSSKLIQEMITKQKVKERCEYSSLERQIFISKRLLIEGQIVTYQSLSLDLYSSTSSLIKDIDRVRSFMDDEVRLISNAKGTRVEGTEMAIQRTIKRFAYYLIEQKLHSFSLSSYSNVFESLFDSSVIKQVHASVQQLISISDQSISQQYLKSLFISLVILTERSYRGFHLSEIPDIQLEGAEYLTNYPLAIDICHNISSKLSFNFTELEHQYISNQLFAHRIQVKVNNAYIENLFSTDIEQMITDVSEAIDTDMNKDDKLFHSLIYHVFPMIYRLKSDIYVYNPLLNEIKNNYGVLFQIVRYSLERLEEKYDIQLTDDDVAFITLHFQVAIERKKQMSQILVVCQTGLVTSDLIIHRIKKLLPANIQFKLIAKPALREEDLSQVDFIISSVQLEHISQPIVYVSPLVRDSDLQQIYAYYLKYSANNQKKEDVMANAQLHSKYIDSRYLFLNEELSSKEQCLNKMIDRLVEDKIVKPSFKKSVYEREKLGNTIVQNWVAIPHALLSMANETKIAIMTTKKPIKWNHETNVSFIILLAVAEEDVMHIRKMLAQLYKVIINSEKFGNRYSIQSIRTPDDLIAFLQSEEDRL